MKQILPAAISRAPVIALIIVALVLFATACATQTRQAASPSPGVQFNLADVPTADRSSLININTATPRELEKLPGIGRVTAERIVSHRTQHGPYRRAEHLMMVRGISDRKFRAFRAMIVVE